VHPSTNYPGRTQEAVLQQLLRKKLEPDIEVWAEQGRDAAAAAGVVDVGGSGRGAGRDEDDEDEEGYRPEDGDGAVAGPLADLWADIRDACLVRVEEYVQNEDQDAYTAEERAMGVEKVRTGLKRNLDEDSEDEDDDEEDEEMPDAGTAPSAVPDPAATAAAAVLEPEYIMWYAARGDINLPANIERDSQRRLKDAAKRPGQGR
jgi:mediator of RNA polymerase II transcription subunit 8